MSAPLDELYFKWLYEQVADPEFQDDSMTYWKVLKVLFTTEFRVHPEVPNDENRVGDVKGLRLKFLRDHRISEVDDNWMDLGSSVLELMVGLSLRLPYEAEGEPHYWFWFHLMRNLGINYSDQGRFPKRRVADILERLVERNYEPSGLGGFFPLQNPRKDQREVELWSQMSAYILEQAG